MLSFFLLGAGIVIGRKIAAHESQNLRVAAPQGSVFWKWFLGDEKNPIVAYSNDLYLMTTRGDLLYYSLGYNRYRTNVNGIDDATITKAKLGIVNPNPDSISSGYGNRQVQTALRLTF